MTTQPDPVPAREQAFAAWLRLAIDAIVPADGSPIRCDAVTGGRIFNRDPVPRGLTTGDVLRGMMRMVDEGVIEWCGVEGPTSVRRRAPAATTLDASDPTRRPFAPGRLRALSAEGEQRLSVALFNARERCYRSLAPASGPPESAERVASLANAAALADAELRGYRAAVADLLGAVPA